MHYVQNTTLQAVIAEAAQIMNDEGYVNTIYLDSVDLPTFGVGTLITKDMPEHGQPVGTPVSEARCASAFFHELCSKTLDDGQRVFGSDWDSFPFEAKKVFVNFMYNVGATRASKFKRMIAAAKNHDWNATADELLDSKYARQVKGRAVRLADRLRSLA